MPLYGCSSLPLYGKRGKSSTSKQRYRCKNCQNRFIIVYNIQSVFVQHRL
ncbi:IS1/IS1595 family N-terminal zinc-binding domain-containing protein [Prevotella histicola]